MKCLKQHQFLSLAKEQKSAYGNEVTWWAVDACDDMIVWNPVDVEHMCRVQFILNCDSDSGRKRVYEKWKHNLSIYAWVGYHNRLWASVMVILSEKLYQRPHSWYGCRIPIGL